MSSDKHQGGIGDTVWQGYVSAISSLLLSLLLLMSILALVLIAFGNARTSGVSAEGQTSLPLPVGRELPERASLKVVPDAAKGRAWALNFPRDTLEVDKGFFENLDKRVLSNTDTASQKWAIVVHTDPSDSLRNRVAYARAMSVREYLLSRKFLPQNIDMDITDGGQQAQGQQDRVYLSRVK